VGTEKHGINARLTHLKLPLDAQTAVGNTPPKPRTLSFCAKGKYSHRFQVPYSRKCILKNYESYVEINI